MGSILLSSFTLGFASFVPLLTPHGLIYGGGLVRVSLAVSGLCDSDSPVNKFLKDGRVSGLLCIVSPTMPNSCIKIVGTKHCPICLGCTCFE